MKTRSITGRKKSRWRKGAIYYMLTIGVVGPAPVLAKPLSSIRTLIARHGLQKVKLNSRRVGQEVRRTNMTQSIKAIYDAILATAKRDELIVVEPEADSSYAAMLCAVSKSLDITPLAVIYGGESKQSELACFTADDDKLLHAMGIKPFRPLPDCAASSPASVQSNG